MEQNETTGLDYAGGKMGQRIFPVGGKDVKSIVLPV